MRRMVVSAAVIISSVGYLIAGVWAAYSSQIRSINQAAIEETTARSEDLARTLAEHTQNTIALVDSVLVILRHEHEDHDVHRVLSLMEAINSVNDFIAILGVIDETGRLVATHPGPLNRTIDFSDREHFQVQRDAATDELYISQPVQSRTTGRWMLQLTRRTTRPDGSFGGVVVAAIDPAYFATLFDGMNLGTNGAVALIGRDRIVRVRTGLSAEEMGRHLDTASLWDAIGDRREGSFRAPGTIDGIDRIVAFRALDRFPLIVTVGLATQDMHAGLSNLTDNILLLAVLASLSVAIIGGFVWLQQRALTRLQGSEERFRSLVESAGTVIIGLSPAGTIREFNPEAERLHGISRAKALGQPYFERILPRRTGNAVPSLRTMLASPTAIRFDTSLSAPDGDERVVSWTAVRQLDHRGRPSGLIATGLDITDRMRAERHLAAAEERLSQILSQAPLPIAIVRLTDNRIVFVNPRAAEMFQLPLDGPTNLASPDFVAQQEERLRFRARLYAQGRVDNSELQLRTAKGELFWALLSAVLIDPETRPAAIISFSNITERKRTEAVLRQSEERFRLLAENATDLIMLHGPDGTTLYASPACTRLLGYDPAEMVGRSAYDFFHPEDLQAIHGSHNAVAEGREPGAAVYRIRRKDGTWTWFETLSRAVVNPGTGAVTEIVTVSRDVSERIRYEQALREERDRIEQQGARLVETAERLEAARCEADQARLAAEQANRAKSSFLATMSHELRTPLNAVLGFSQIIKDLMFGRDAIDRYAEYAADICASGQHLLDLIDDILDLSKIEAGRLEIDPEPVDLAELMQGALRLVRERAEKRGLVLALDLPERPPEIRADRRAVKQILFNLLSNAIKFTPAGGRVTAGAARAGGDAVAITVTDTGIGIPADQIARVMQPFEQIDNRYSRTEGGTGLGLPLVKALVELHGGRFDLASTVGAGTTATVRLPLHATEASGQIVLGSRAGR